MKYDEELFGTFRLDRIVAGKVTEEMWAQVHKMKDRKKLTLSAAVREALTLWLRSTTVSLEDIEHIKRAERETQRTILDGAPKEEYSAVMRVDKVRSLVREEKLKIQSWGRGLEAEDYEVIIEMVNGNIKSSKEFPEKTSKWVVKQLERIIEELRIEQKKSPGIP